MKHGHSGYSNHGCKCEECRIAYNAYTKKRKYERAAELKADPTIVQHGLPSTYDNWMCRCDACKRAHNEYNAYYRTRSKK